MDVLTGAFYFNGIWTNGAIFQRAVYNRCCMSMGCTLTLLYFNTGYLKYVLFQRYVLLLLLLLLLLLALSFGFEPLRSRGSLTL